MSGGSFAVGQRMRFDGQNHRVMRALDDREIILEELATGRISKYKLIDLVRRWSMGEITLGDGTLTHRSLTERAIEGAYADEFFQSCTEKQQLEAKKRLAFVERLKDVPKTSNVLAEAIHKVWADKKLWGAETPFDRCPSTATIKRWIHRWEKSARDIRSLVPREAAKGNRQRRQHDDVAKIVQDLINDRYLTLERPSLKSIHKDAVALVALRNKCRLESDQLQRPSYGYVQSQLKKLVPYDICRARYGQAVADIRFRAALGGAVAGAPLARAAIDHTRLDLFVLDSQTGLPLGRPWLTLVLDEHSRYVLGYYLGFEEPSSVSMSLALRHAITPKKKQETWKNEWDAWGLMDVLVCDNGMEFHGRILEAGAGRFGITIQFCPRRKPWYKGKIERLLRTVHSDLLAEVPGKTFSNILEKADYDPANHALITLETLRSMFEKWIVDVYHQEIHRVLKSSPRDAWEAGLPLVDRSLPPSSLAVDSAFSVSDKRQLTHKGIEYDCLLYNSNDLAAVRHLHGEGIKVEVRARNDDLGSILVVTPDNTLVKVPALDQDYAAGLTRWQHGLCKKVQRRRVDDDARDISLFEARQEIRQMMEDETCFITGKGRSSKPRTKARFLEQFAEERQQTAPASSDEPPAIDADEAPVDDENVSDGRVDDRVASDLADLEDEELPVFGVRMVGGTASQ